MNQVEERQGFFVTIKIITAGIFCVGCSVILDILIYYYTDIGVILYRCSSTTHYSAGTKMSPGFSKFLDFLKYFLLC